MNAIGAVRPVIENPGTVTEPMSQRRVNAEEVGPAEMVFRFLPFLALIAVLFFTLGTHTHRAALFLLQLALGVLSVAAWIRPSRSAK